MRLRPSDQSPSANGDPMRYARRPAAANADSPTPLEPHVAQAISEELRRTIHQTKPSMSEKTVYSINLDVKFEPLSVIDIHEIVATTPEPWFNQTLTRVNDSVVRIGILHGEFHWHKHEHDDEFFYVVDGTLLIDFEDRTVELQAKQGLTVPRGVLHRTRAPQKVVILMVETAGIVPTGD